MRCLVKPGDLVHVKDINGNNVYQIGMILGKEPKVAGDSLYIEIFLPIVGVRIFPIHWLKVIS